MSYYKLININKQFHNDMLNINFNNYDEHYDDNDINNKLFICHNLEKYLRMMKYQIFLNHNQWDNIKKYTNPYEFIHTNIPKNKFSISKYKPISRAFFKLLEIFNTFKILKYYDNIKSISTFHLAEGPGGFLEATAYLRKNKDDKYHGITLIDNNNICVPGWKKSEMLLNKYKNINILKGVNNKGDLFNHLNLDYCYKHHKSSMHIITGDGGFDFSVNYGKQEVNAIRLILTQVFYAIIMQKPNGHFILKIFDIFYKSTVDVIYMLSLFYNEVHIIKPNTSRHANSEKYIVCKFFKNINVNIFIDKFKWVLTVLNNTDLKKFYIHSILDIKYQHIYLSKLIEINTILGQQQLDCISITIKTILFKDKYIENFKLTQKHNIEKCINWCIKHNIEYNKEPIPMNIFLNR